VLHDVEIAKVDIEVPPIQVENSSAVHHLAPFEGAKYLTRPAQLFERSRVDLASVVHGEVPVAVGTKLTTSPGPAEVHCLGIGEPTARGNDPIDELIIHHVHSVPDERPTCPHDAGPGAAHRHLWATQSDSESSHPGVRLR
jgi:hypothetical protein